MTEPRALLVRGALELWTGRPGAAMRHAGSADVRIRDGVVAAIGTLAPEPGERVLDASGCVIYPGWVNTHHHLFQSLLKGVPEGLHLPLTPWLAAVTVPYRRHFDREQMLRIAVRVGLVELALSGCSTVADHQYLNWPGMPYDASAVVFDEADRLGLRLVLARGGQTLARKFAVEAPPQAAPETLDAMLTALEADVRRFHDAGPRPMRRVAAALNTPTWGCRPDELAAIAAAARRLGVRLHSHLSESDDYVRWAREVHGCTPLQFVAEHGWVGPDVWYAHMVHLADDEIRLCAATGTGVAHCPQSNARLGSGIARVPEMMAAGVPVGLAVDGAASNEAADVASEAHACWLLHRADPRRGAQRRDTPMPGGDPAALSVEDVVHLGTAGGARVLGLDEAGGPGGIGTLEVGAAADLAVYDLDDPRHFGLHDPAIAPVASGARPRLRALLVGGRVVVEHDRIPGLDLAELRHDARSLVAAMRSTS